MTDIRGYTITFKTYYRKGEMPQSVSYKCR